jgi:hypothetical protein
MTDQKTASVDTYFVIIPFLEQSKFQIMYFKTTRPGNNMRSILFFEKGEEELKQINMFISIKITNVISKNLRKLFN